MNLKNKNYFKTGGSAAYFKNPKNEEKFSASLAHAKEKELGIFVLGAGANVLISDEGFDGLVIQPKFEKIWHEDFNDKNFLVHAQAGTHISQLINYCLDNKIIGLEEFSGIPGTVGGSVYNNMHYFEFSLSDFLHKGRIIHRETCKIEDVSKNWFCMGYDNSKLHEKKQYLISASFKLKKATTLETEYAKGRQKEIIRHRFARYPREGTCGCFFRNFHPDEVSIKIPGTNRKMIYVAYYLDKLGIKGELNVGDAVVSHQHANMLVNKGNATSKDLVDLARTLQKMVFDKFGIIPQPECELVGFKKYPLLK